MAYAPNDFSGLQPVAAPPAAPAPAVTSSGGPPGASGGAAPAAPPPATSVPGAPASGPVPPPSATDFSGLKSVAAPSDFSSLAPTTPYERVKALEPAILDPSTPDEKRPQLEQEYLKARAEDVMQNDQSTRMARAISNATWGDIGSAAVTGYHILKNVGGAIADLANPTGLVGDVAKVVSSRPEGTGVLSSLAGGVGGPAGSAVGGGAVGAVGDTAQLLLNAGSKVGEIENEYMANASTDPEVRQNAARFAAQMSLNRLKANAAYGGFTGLMGESFGSPEAFAAGRTVGNLAAFPSVPGVNEAMAGSLKTVSDLTEKGLNLGAGTALAIPGKVAKAAPVAAPILTGVHALTTGGVGPFLKVAGAEAADALAGAARTIMSNPDSTLGSIFSGVKQGRQAIKTYLFTGSGEAGKMYRTTQMGESAFDSILRQSPALIEKAQADSKVAQDALAAAQDNYRGAQQALKNTGASPNAAQTALQKAQDAANAANMRVDMLQKGVTFTRWLKAQGVTGLTEGMANAISGAVHGAVIGGALGEIESSPGDTSTLLRGVGAGAFYGGLLGMFGMAAAQSAEPPILGGPDAPWGTPHNPVRMPPSEAPKAESPVPKGAGEPPLLAPKPPVATGGPEPTAGPKDEHVVIDGVDHNVTEVERNLQNVADATVDHLSQKANGIVSGAVGAPVPSGAEPQVPGSAVLEAPGPSETSGQAVPAPQPVPRPDLSPLPAKPVGYAGSQPKVGVETGKQTENWGWAPPIKDPQTNMPEKVASREEAQVAVDNHVEPNFGSTNIRSYGYNPDAQLLSVRFHNPSRGSDHYLYHDVPQEDFDEWVKNNQQTAEEASAGQHHYHNIRLDYPYVRVTDDMFGDGGASGRQAGFEAKEAGQAKKVQARAAGAAGQEPGAAAGPLATAETKPSVLSTENAGQPSGPLAKTEPVSTTTGPLAGTRTPSSKFYPPVKPLSTPSKEASAPVSKAALDAYGNLKVGDDVTATVMGQDVKGKVVQVQAPPLGYAKVKFEDGRTLPVPPSQMKGLGEEGPVAQKATIQTRGADIERMLKMQGEKMYAGHVSRTTGKELVQNAIDQVMTFNPKDNRRIGFGYQLDEDAKGDEYGYKPGRFFISDNGQGMSPEEILTKFLPAAVSGKGLGEGGGLGMAKLAILGGNPDWTVTTVTRSPSGGLIATTLKGSGDGYYNFVNAPPKVDLAPDTDIQISNGMSMRYHEYHGNEVDAPDHTGTVVNVKTDKPEKAQAFVNKALEYTPSIQKIPLQIPAEGTTPTDPHTPEGMAGLNTIGRDIAVKTDYKLYHQIETPSATIDFIVPDKGGAGLEMKRDSYHTVPVLNRSILQFDKGFNFDDAVELPKGIAVNIKPKVLAENSNYPFTMNREDFHSDTGDEVMKYFKAQGEELVKRVNDRYKSAVENAPSMSEDPSIKFLDATGYLTPETVHEITHDPVVNSMAQTVGKIQKSILNLLERTYPAIEQFGRASFAGLLTGGDAYGVHFGKPNKAWGSNPETSPSTIFHDPFKTYRDAADDARAYIKENNLSTDELPGLAYDLWVGKTAGVGLHEAGHQLISEEGQGLARFLTFHAGDVVPSITTALRGKNAVDFQKVYDTMTKYGPALEKATSGYKKEADKLIVSQGGYIGYALKDVRSSSGQGGARGEGSGGVLGGPGGEATPGSAVGPLSRQ